MSYPRRKKNQSPQVKELQHLLFPLPKLTNHPVVVSPHSKSSISHAPIEPLQSMFGKCDPSTTEWVGLKPLEMVDQLLDMMDQSFTIDDKYSKRSLRFDKLTSPGMKRNREPQLLDLEESQFQSMENLLSSTQTKPVDEEKMVPWKLDYPDPHFQEYIKTHSSDVKMLQSLIKTFESHPSSENCSPCYHRLKSHFEKVVLEGPCGINPMHVSDIHDDGESKVHTWILDNLWSSTVQKMKALIDMAQKEENVSQFNIPSSPSLTGKLLSPNGSLPLAKTQKKKFAKYMSNWLIENWTNPYPDDDTLQDIARKSGMTSKEVGNWLINARTRKWRPAIIKAYNMNRPADVLLEDAIHIYQDTPVRKLDFDSFDKNYNVVPVVASKGKKKKKKR